MHLQLIAHLRDPYTASTLELVQLQEQDGYVLEGILLNAERTTAYCLHKGVCIMLRQGFSAGFLQTHAAAIAALKVQHPNLSFGTQSEDYYNFGAQWTEHQQRNMEKTWGWHGSERLEMFYQEIQTTPAQLIGKTILDAGCGNGILTHSIAAGNSESTVFGIDYSFSLLHTATVYKRPNLGYIIADIHHPPFAPGSMDVVISNGVLHHTPNTQKAFNAIAPLVANGGKLYIWLYRRPATGYGVFLRYSDFLRRMTQLLPGKSKLLTVHFHTALLYAAKKVTGRQKAETYNDLFIIAHDALTPRYRYYHQPIEVSLWYFDAGFGPIALTHWDDPHGFGVVAVKEQQANTPGINFTRIEIVKRFNK